MRNKSHFRCEGKSGNPNVSKQGHRQGKKSISLIPSATNQPPERIYKLNRLDASPDWYRELQKLRLWQRRQNHQRWIRSFILADQARTLHVTVSFRHYESLVHVRETSRRMVRRWSLLVGGWVKVLELGGRGVHVHFVLHYLVHLNVGEGVESVGSIVRKYQSKERIGWWEVKPVGDADALSCYLTKQFRPGNKRYRLKGRAITYSASVEREPWWLATYSCVANSELAREGSA